MDFLFDIGRVLLDFDFETSLARLIPPDVKDPHERLGLLIERKDAFEAGEIEESEFIAWAIGRMGSTATHEEFRHAWRNIFTPNEPMWETATRLMDAGHRLILFSNINPIHWPWIMEEYPRFSQFQHAVLSFEAGSIKPEPEIYQYAIEHHGLDPLRTRYIDDLPANIAGGRAFGLRSWQYDLRDHDAFEKWLEEELALG